MWDKRGRNLKTVLKGIKKCSLIGKAIRKYGLENFKIEILEECSAIEQLDERENFGLPIKNL